MSQLVYHDLINVPLGAGKPGIYWLRLFVTDDADYLAVVTEVPGNPSASVTNAISRIADHVMGLFNIGTRHLQLYQVWPRGSHGGEVGIKHIGFGATLRWRKTSRRELETGVGMRLPAVPPHHELYARVVAHGGGVYREVGRYIFEPFPVGNVPPPHRPFQRAHASRFEDILNSISSEEDDSHALHLAAGRQFLATLRASDLAACSYHQADWKAIANESVRIIEENGERESGHYILAARRSGLNGSDHRGLVSLFEHPIFIGGGGYTDGQHRACALRFSGAERAAIAIREQLVREECEDWVYEGGGWSTDACHRASAAHRRALQTVSQRSRRLRVSGASRASRPRIDDASQTVDDVYGAVRRTVLDTVAEE